MNQYLTAIGFDKVHTQKEVFLLLDDVQQNFERQAITSGAWGADHCEFRKEYGRRIGVSLIGELDGQDTFTPEYYFPYFAGEGITSVGEVFVEQRLENEMFEGVCEDERVGISLIFLVQNGAEYRKELQKGLPGGGVKSVTLSGLALGGSILFPVLKSELEAADRKARQQTRQKLINAAKSGDKAAIEMLTLEDMDAYTRASRRLASEDILSIVDTYLMPNGVECDQYSILGEILAYHTVANTATGTELYQLKLEVNELVFDVCVPVKEVLGEPEIGRRFKGNIWLQGKVNL